MVVFYSSSGLNEKTFIGPSTKVGLSLRFQFRYCSMTGKKKKHGSVLFYKMVEKVKWKKWKDQEHGYLLTRTMVKEYLAGQ